MKVNNDAGFTLIEVVLFQTGAAQTIAQAMTSVSWLLILGAFMLVSWFASRVAHAATSPVAQYAALGGFVLAEALLFVPTLYIASARAPGASLNFPLPSLSQSRLPPWRLARKKSGQPSLLMSPWPTPSVQPGSSSPSSAAMSPNVPSPSLCHR